MKKVHKKQSNNSIGSDASVNDVDKISLRSINSSETEIKTPNGIINTKSSINKNKKEDTLSLSKKMKSVGGHETPTAKEEAAEAEPDEEYEVEAVVGHKVSRGISYYKIRWKGYSANDDSWEKNDSLSCRDLINLFHKKDLKQKRNSLRRSSDADNNQSKNSIEDQESEVPVTTASRKRKTNFSYVENEELTQLEDSDDEPILKNINNKRNVANNKRGRKSLNLKEKINQENSKTQKIDQDEKMNEQYEVEAIVGHKLINGMSNYRIRWKGYGKDYDSWEAEDSLSCQEMIDNFHKKGQVSGNITLSKDSTDEKSDSLKKGNKRVKGQELLATDEQNKEKSDEKEEEFEVEAIVGHKISHGISYYQIRWKGFDAESDTWEMEDSLSCQSLINNFHKNQKDNHKTLLDRNKSKSQKLDTDQDPEKQWEVDKILDYGLENNERYFLIRWKGYNSKSDTWEPEKNLNCKDLITKFMEKMEKNSNVTLKNLREHPKQTKRLVNEVRSDLRSRKSARNGARSRILYYEEDYSE